MQYSCKPSSPGVCARASAVLQQDRADALLLLHMPPHPRRQSSPCIPASASGGGDGTLNEVVGALMQHREAISRQGLSVALLPLGTANDFAAAAGISVVSPGLGPACSWRLPPLRGFCSSHLAHRVQGVAQPDLSSSNLATHTHQHA